TASGALTGTELFYSDNGAADVKVTANQLKTFIVGAGAVSVASGKALTVSNTNTSGNPTGVLLNLTQTAAGTTSKFADFQLGGTSKINLATGGTTPTALLNIAGANFGGWQIVNGSDAGVTNNYEYLSAYVSSNIWIIDSGKIGTGTARTLRFQQA